MANIYVSSSRYSAPSKLQGWQWLPAATIVHELAHVNDAPGTDTQAEDTL